MSFYIESEDLLDEFGIDLRVWSNDVQNEQAYPGGPTAEVSTDNEPEIRHEPVLPLNPRSAIGQQLTAGGAQIGGQLVWYSSKWYPPGTIVEVPDQNNGKYQTTDYSSYNPYSHFYEYVLKGDSQDGI